MFLVKDNLRHSTSSGNKVASRPSTMPSDSESPAAIARASAPFDDPRGDIILRTSDDVNFHVLKIVLELASPVFKDMISLPQPREGRKGENLVPIIPVSESSTTLDPVLRFCYPVKPPDFDKQDLSTIGAVLRAALKYDIDAAIYPTRSALKDHLKDNEESALTIYAIACDLKLAEEARLAARESLRWPVLRVLVPQFTSISTTDCFHLVEFHRRSSEAITHLFNQNAFFRDTCGDLLSDRGCMCIKQSHDYNRKLLVPLWLLEAASEMEKAVKAAPLDIENRLLFSDLRSVVQLVHKRACTLCSELFLTFWEEIKRKIKEEIEKEVSKVHLFYMNHKY